MTAESTSIIEKQTLNDIIAEYSATEILEIKMSEMTVPIETAAEVSQLYAVEKKVFLELLKNKEEHEETGKVSFDPDALKWAKELRQTAKLVHELTGKIQEKQMYKKMDMITELYKKAMETSTSKEQAAKVVELRNRSE